VADLLSGKGALDVLPQGMGLGEARLNVLAATVATALFAAWNDPLLAAQPNEFATGCLIDAAIHLPDQPLQRRYGDAGLALIMNRFRAHVHLNGARP
jgi:hypothetical protein